MAQQLAAHVVADPTGTADNVAPFVKVYTLTPSKAESDGSTLEHSEKQTDHSTPEASLDLTIRDDTSRTFYYTYWLPAYRAETPLVIAFRPKKNEPVSPTNREIRAQLKVFNAELKFEALADIEDSRSARVVGLIESSDGVNWIHYHTGAPAVAF